MSHVNSKVLNAKPSKIICVGRNYAEHAVELGNEVPDDLVIFLKPNSSISETLLSQHQGEQLHYEAEICFLVEGGKFVAVGVGLDLTKRELQSRLKAKSLPWDLAKGFDGAAVFSEFVALPESGIDELTLSLEIEGELRQQGDVSQMLFKPQYVLDQVQKSMTVCDGDIIMTGTPKGVGPVVAGTTFQATVSVGDTPLVSLRKVSV